MNDEKDHIKLITGDEFFNVELVSTFMEYTVFKTEDGEIMARTDSIVLKEPMSTWAKRAEREVGEKLKEMERMLQSH